MMTWLIGQWLFGSACFAAGFVLCALLSKVDYLPDSADPDNPFPEGE